MPERITCLGIRSSRIFLFATLRDFGAALPWPAGEVLLPRYFCRTPGTLRQNNRTKLSTFRWKLEEAAGQVDRTVLISKFTGCSSRVVTVCTLKTSRVPIQFGETFEVIESPWIFTVSSKKVYEAALKIATEYHFWTQVGHVSSYTAMFELGPNGSITVGSKPLRTNIFLKRTSSTTCPL